MPNQSEDIKDHVIRLPWDAVHKRRSSKLLLGTISLFENDKENKESMKKHIRNCILEVTIMH